MKGFLFTSVSCADSGSVQMGVSTPSSVTRWSHLEPLELSVSGEGAAPADPHMVHPGKALCAVAATAAVSIRASVSEKKAWYKSFSSDSSNGKILPGPPSPTTLMRVNF